MSSEIPHVSFYASTDARTDARTHAHTSTLPAKITPFNTVGTV